MHILNRSGFATGVIVRIRFSGEVSDPRIHNMTTGKMDGVNRTFTAGSFSLNSLITEESRTLLTPENISWIAGDDAGVIEYVQQKAGTDPTSP